MKGARWAATTVLAAGLLAGCWGGSTDEGASVAPLASSPTVSASASASESGQLSPSASSSPSSTATESPTATNSLKPSDTKKPKPDASIAPDGLPVVVINTPEPGASVNIPVVISGTAVAFEAVLRYEILNSQGKRFTNGPAYADAGAPERGRWKVEVELPIGSYTVVAFVESPENGKRIAEDRVKFRAG